MEELDLPFSELPPEEGLWDTGNLLCPYMPSVDEKVHQMFSVVNICDADVIVDLGCGDGRVLFEAVNFGCKSAIGVELNHDLVLIGQEKIEKLGLSEKIRIFEDDFMNVEISEATIIYMYLLPEAMDKLKPILIKALNANVRLVISAHFSIRGWRKSDEIRVDGFNCYTKESFDE